MPKRSLSTLLALPFLFVSGMPAHAQAPSDANLGKVGEQLESESKALSDAVKALKTSGPNCDVTMFFVSIGNKASEALNELKPSTDGAMRNVPDSVAFQRKRIGTAISGTLSSIADATAKAEASGDASNAAKLSAKALQDLDAVLAAEIALSRTRIAEGEAKKNQLGAATAMNNVKESANPNCQTLSRAIAQSDKNNNRLLTLMQDARKAAKAYGDNVTAWAAAVKKPAPPAPAPAPAAPPAKPAVVVPPPANPATPAAPPVAPAPPKPTPAAPKPSESTTLTVAPPTKPAPAAPTPGSVTLVEAPPAAAPVVQKKETPPAPAPTPAQKPVADDKKPKTFGAPILPPSFSTPLKVQIAPSPTDLIEQKPLLNATEVKVRPFDGLNVEACEDTSVPPNVLPIQPALKAVDALTAPPLPPSRPSPLQLQIAGESRSASPHAKGVEPFDRARDVWGTEKQVSWKKYDQEKRSQGILLPPAADAASFKLALDKLGSPLGTLESRARLQKAINALALRLDKGGKPRAPTVFQDGVLGSRTKNALVYYMKRNPKEFREALQRQGFNPSW